MDSDRRSFVRHSLVVLGSALTGGPAHAAGKAAGKSCCGGGCGVAAVAATGPAARPPAPAASPTRPARGPPAASGSWSSTWPTATAAATARCVLEDALRPARPAVDQGAADAGRRVDRALFFPQPCYHCDNPPCTKVCPVDATFKRQDGIVLIDNDRCIGCRFCMAACPYGARSFNWGHPQDPPEAKNQPYSPEQGFPRRVGTVEKCDFCPDMAEQGKLPRAPRSARWARSTTATRTRTPSPTPRARRAAVEAAARQRGLPAPGRARDGAAASTTCPQEPRVPRAGRR